MFAGLFGLRLPTIARQQARDKSSRDKKHITPRLTQRPFWNNEGQNGVYNADDNKFRDKQILALKGKVISHTHKQSYQN